MASSIPSQTRTVDPYASYNSNVVNQLTGIVTRGDNVLDYYDSLQVVPDSTSMIDHVVLLPGIVYKDDMLIEILSEFRIDFTDPDHYVSAAGDPFNTEAGIYYIVLEYSYVKSRPAPQAHVKILLPSQTSTFRSGAFPSLFFLKAVRVQVSGGSGSITNLYDYDPDHPTTKREYVKNYAGSESILPTFNQRRDQSRIIYVPTEDEFYFGYSNRWDIAGGKGSTFEANTLGFSVGDLVYVNSSGNLSKAISTLSISTADGVVSKIGINGLVQTTGYITNVPIESGNNVIVGNLLYLSGVEPGTVTKEKTSPFYQFVGRSVGVDSTTADILFVRGEPSGTPTANLTKSVTVSMDSTAGWILDGSGLYYQDVDISAFTGKDVVVNIFKPLSHYSKFYPADFEFIDDDTLRVWMTVNYLFPELVILGKSSSTIGTSNTITLTKDMVPPNWVFGTTQYYQVMDVSSLNGVGAVMVVDQATNKVIQPSYVNFWDSTTLIISMPDDSHSLSVTVIGDSNVGGGSNVTFSTTLGSGASWNPSGGSYYQDVDVSEIGLNTSTSILGLRDFDTDFEVIPGDIEIISSTVFRIWMPTDTLSLAVTVSG